MPYALNKQKCLFIGLTHGLVCADPLDRLAKLSRFNFNISIEKMVRIQFLHSNLRKYECQKLLYNDLCLRNL